MERKGLIRKLSVRITEADHAALSRMAQQFGTKPCRLMRKIICESAGMGPYLLDGELDIFREALRQVRAVGVNLNQLTRAVNAGKTNWSSEDSQTVQATARAIDSLRQELTTIITRSRHRPVKDAA